MIRSFTLCTLLFITTLLSAQHPVFTGLVPETDFSGASALTAEFNNWDIYKINVQAFDNYVKNAGSEMEFSLELDGKYDWNIWLEPHDLRSPNYISRASTENGIVTTPQTENITFRGHLKNPGGGTVALTIDDDFIYGLLHQNGEMYFIEPLWYFMPDQPKDLFVVYAATDVKPNPDAKCGLTELNKTKLKIGLPDGSHEDKGETKAMLACKEIEIAIASDWLMFDLFNSQAAVEAFETGTLNNCQANWDNEFNDELQFVIVEFFTVTTSNGDPWTSSLNSITLLNSFTSWAPSGFFATHDIGCLWTDRTVQSGTVGIAWLGVVCTSSKYHVVWHHTNNSNNLRQTWTHEMGHNFNAEHDANGSPFIMAPTVNGSNTWSSFSLNTINNYYPNRWCLTGCAGGLPPVANFSANPTNGCVPMTVQFNDLSLNNPTGWEWSFPGGTPATSTQQNPVVTYNSVGVYSASLTVDNGAGSNSITIPAIVNVDTEPLASFSFNQIGLTVIFTNTSTPNADTYLWNFGDGLTSTEENPIHSYATDGFYEVSLTAFNDCGSNTFTFTVPAFLAPTAGFYADPTAGCATFTVDFNNLSSANVVDYFWEFEGGSPATSTVESPTVQYNAPGMYDVTLTVSNPAGTSIESFSNYITVATVPTPGFNFGVIGNTATFVNTTSNSNGLGTVTYSWDFGDGATSTQVNPEHTYATNGDFDVTLTATNDCGSATITQTVTIETPPTASFSANVTTGCEPLSVTFMNESSPNASSFNWSFPGGNPATSTAEEPTVVYNDPGTYTVTLIVSNNAGSDTITLVNYITVDPLPTPGFTSVTNGLTATFTNTSADATGYLWNFGDGNTSTETDPVHTYTEDGTYTVTLTATNDCGDQVLTQTVVIVTPPTAGFSAATTEGCAPLTVQFMNESSENAVSFEWEFPGGDPATSTAENPSVTYNDPGTYTVTLTVTNAAGNATVTETNYIVVNTVPAAGFNAMSNNNVATFDNTSVNATSYSWAFGDGGSSTEEDPEHTYNEDGIYTVTLIATNDCGSDTTEQSITIVTPPTAGFSAGTTTGCAPLTVQFTNESSENATSFEWEFQGGTPSSSTDENPTVTYNDPGTYSVTLTVSNAAGNNTITQTSYITVTTVPDPSFTTFNDVFTVHFTNTTDNATSYSWEFGDGGTSTEEDPVHEYATDGTYSVTLTATNDCGSNTITQEVVVTSLPSAAFSANTTTGCAPFTVQFMDESSSNSESWSWEFPGGNPATSTEQNPVVTYNSVGTYTVTLTVGNSLGENTVSQTDYIVVVTTPVAGFTSATNLLTASFDNVSSGATSYEWNFGDGSTSNEADPSHTYNEDGTYTVTLTATNDCGSVTFSETITVVSLPTAGFNADESNGCAPFEVQFNNTSSENAVTFAWEFPGGTPATSADENPLVTYDAPGIYSVTLTVSNAAGNDMTTLTDYIVVGTTPVAGFTGDENGSDVTFTNTSTNPANSGPVTYSWDFGDGSMSSEENPVHTYQADGTYDVTLTATNDCGSTTFTRIVVIATAGPIAAFQVEDPAGCAPYTVTFENLSSDNSETFEWEFPGGDPATSTEVNPTVTYNAAGVYDVTLTATNALGNSTVTEVAYIVVNSVPTPGFTSTSDLGTVTFTNTSDNATSYEWNFGDGEMSTEENPVHTYTASGEYEVTLSAFNECGFSSNTMTIIVMLTGVEEIPGISEFNVFPNPNQGHFTLMLRGEGMNDLSVQFTNVLGQVILQDKIDFRTGQLTKDYTFNELAAGMYIFQVKSGNRALYRKVVVE